MCDADGMAKRTSKPSDVNALAAAIVDEATAEIPMTEDGKNAYAVALGRRGGRKGGPARAKKLSAERRSEIAQKAAQTRWAKREPKPS